MKILLAALLAVVTAAPPTPPATLPPIPNPTPRAPIADGTYTGVLAWPFGSFRYSSDRTNLASTWSLSGGRVNLEVAGTRVTGDWTFTLAVSGGGTTEGVGSGLADGTVVASGTFEGDANAPCMTGFAQITGTMAIVDDTGFSAEIALDETVPIDCARFTWYVSSSSCNGASGEWTLPLADELTMQGIGFPTNGTFSIWRTGAGPSDPAESAAVEELIAGIDRVIGTEPLDGRALADILQRVAEIEGNAARNAACGERSRENTRIVGDHVYRLVIDRFQRPEEIDLRTLRWLAYAALNTGVLGAASMQPERATQLDTLLRSRLVQMIDEAVSARDALMLARISILARQYGWEQIEAVADGSYAEITGEG